MKKIYEATTLVFRQYLKSCIHESGPGTFWYVFLNSHFFLDSLTKLSFLDILLLSESNQTNSSRELFDYVM
jgi:hypothetical protein